MLAILNGAFLRLTRVLLASEARKRLASQLKRDGSYGGGRTDSLMLAIQHRESGTIIGVAELSQQPRDGKVPGDIRFPSAPWMTPPAQVAYTSNLAVRREWRGSGLGRTLVCACEELSLAWGFDEVYLHAATQQQRLLDMYATMDYEALPSFDQPDWVLALSGREETRYHKKGLQQQAAHDAVPNSM